MPPPIFLPFIFSSFTSSPSLLLLFFFFNDTATTEIYTLSLHDALPISGSTHRPQPAFHRHVWPAPGRSEEHTSELQSPDHLVCRLLLEKKKNMQPNKNHTAIKNTNHRKSDEFPSQAESSSHDWNASNNT